MLAVRRLNRWRRVSRRWAVAPRRSASRDRRKPAASWICRGTLMFAISSNQKPSCGITARKAMPPTAFAVPEMTMKRSEASSSSLELGGRGGLRITPGLRSKARASAGGPSAMTLIHSSWAAVSGNRNVPPIGSLMPSWKVRARPTTMSTMSARSVEKKNRMNFWMFS